MAVRPYRIRDLVLTDHTVAVPLDHAEPRGGQIEVFAREVVAADKEHDRLPWLVFLQGGPGFEAPRPTKHDDPAWLPRALAEFRVLMLDQRGVGRSSPVGPRDVAVHGAAGLAARLVHYRADSIVRDCEVVRQALGVDRWALLGQSFGGFCAVSYLSLHPESLDLVLVTGGLPPLDRSIDQVYAWTYRRTADKTARHYARHPGDRDRVAAVGAWLQAEDVRLPSGDRLTPRRFRQVGAMLGASDGSARLHYLLELPMGSPAFLHDVADATPFDRNPLYAVVHEACYAAGRPTRWSAERLLPDSFADDPAALTGEHVYPWMFDEYAGLHPFAETAQVLADHEWGPLWDVERLAANEVPAAAAVYAEDMYVERTFSEETAGRIRGLRPWVTNEYEHDGLRADGVRVLDRLLALARDRA